MPSLIIQKLERLLQQEPNHRRRIDEYYLPLFQWVTDTVKKRAEATHPMMIGINGPQGCGKSTLTRILVNTLPEVGLRAVTVSIDDFYLTHAEQMRLARQHCANPLLQQRGYPGTHDVELGFRTLHALKQINEKGTVICPIYDKSRFDGQGDRAPKKDWNPVTAPLNVIFIEGWMLGFPAVSEDQLSEDSWKEINAFLRNYKTWHDLLDGFIQLVPQDISFVVDWRVEAEAKMRAEGKSGMTPSEAFNYVSKFLPAYSLYIPYLSANPPVSKNVLQLVLAKDRLPTS